MTTWEAKLLPQNRPLCHTVVPRLNVGYNYRPLAVQVLIYLKYTSWEAVGVYLGSTKSLLVRTFAVFKKTAWRLMGLSTSWTYKPARRP